MRSEGEPTSHRARLLLFLASTSSGARLWRPPALRPIGNTRVVERILGHLGLPAGPAERQAYRRASCVIWIRLPQVSFSMAMVEPVTSVGGMVNSAPRALARSYSPSRPLSRAEGSQNHWNSDRSMASAITV